MANDNNSSDLAVLSVLGKDRPGLVSIITEKLVLNNINIVDIEAKSMRGLFAMFIIIDFSDAKLSIDKLKDIFSKVSHKNDLKITLEVYEKGRRKPDKDLMLLTTLGSDRPGIVHNLSKIFKKYRVNIESIRMISRGELFAMEVLIDVSDINVNIKEFWNKVQTACEDIGLSIVFQKENIFSKAKKLIVFDMDSTLITQEIIDEIASAVGAGDAVKKITLKAMQGEINYTEAIKQRVKLLEGVDVSILENIAKNMILTAGAEELISSLKLMGYKIAIISGGFNYFTSILKKKLGIDYVFSNKLIIKNGKLTGRLEEPIIDGEKKGELISWIADMENISKDEIVAVGDGATDKFMLNESGLGIAFNPKKVLKKYADGVITQKNLIGLLYVLGISDKKIKELLSNIDSKNKIKNNNK
ncbi:MAG: phosphoserine phosphatase SerB [Promethearchaeota archaeon]|nr:MAG: phosphoserine phosphatase SerB [Candidatus Lokiarchaeota archaeon]